MWLLSNTSVFYLCADQTLEGEAETKRRVWQMTTSSGVSFSINGSIHRDLPSILTFKATDPGTKQVTHCRSSFKPKPRVAMAYFFMCKNMFIWDESGWVKGGYHGFPTV